MALPHPRWKREFEAKQRDFVLRNAPQNVKVVTFDEYFGRE